MKPTDLQIRDWVSYIGKDFNDYVDRVSGIIDGCVVLDKEMIHRSIDNIHPIPLTVEILERNGFELRDGFLYHRIDDKPHHYDFKLKNGGVFTSEGYTLECGIYSFTIGYVHELQHALRLCGLNDLADNFKVEE